MNNWTPRPYQTRAVEFLLTRYLSGHPGAGLFLDPGLGKTSTTLATFDLLRTLGEAQTALVVAPLRVIYSVWEQEAKKWGFNFEFSRIHGPRKAKATADGADIYLINPEAIPWLAKTTFRTDFLIVDESTKFKSWSAQRTKALRKILPRFPLRAILTGTPAPNSLMDVHAQIFLLDNGESLGKTLGFFRAAYCQENRIPGQRWSRWEFRPDRREDLEEKIASLVLRLAARDHLDLPPLLENPVWVDLPGPIREEYQRLERDFFLHLKDGERLEASGAGALYSLCRGVANGGGYQKDLGERRSVFVHDAKTDAVVDLVEELSGKPLLVAYQFHHDAERLLARFPHAPVIRGGQDPRETDKIVRKWNARQIPVLLAHPACMAHGLNLQAGGNDVCWLGLNDSLELYQQFNQRIFRQGVEGTVRIHQILARDTIDEAVLDRISSKDRSQAALMDALQRYQQRREADEPFLPSIENALRPRRVESSVCGSSG